MYSRGQGPPARMQIIKIRIQKKVTVETGIKQLNRIEIEQMRVLVGNKLVKKIGQAG